MALAPGPLTLLGWEATLACGGSDLGSHGLRSVPEASDPLPSLVRPGKYAGLMALASGPHQGPWPMQYGSGCRLSDLVVFL